MRRPAGEEETAQRVVYRTSNSVILKPKLTFHKNIIFYYYLSHRFFSSFSRLLCCCLSAGKTSRDSCFFFEGGRA